MTPPSHSNLAKIAEVNVREAFEMSRNEFANAVDAAIRKIQFAYNKSGGDLYMSSSFGPQSAVLIQLVEDSGLHLPVVCVNIKTPTYDKQRDYKETLRRHFNLVIHNFDAANDDVKVQAMTEGLDRLNVRALIDGIRKSQTENRAGKNFIETDRRRFGAINYHPMLDFTDDVTHDFIMNAVAEEARYPKYKKGMRAMGGGDEIAPGQVKPECGLHLNPDTGKLERRIQHTNDPTHG